MITRITWFVMLIFHSVLGIWFAQWVFEDMMGEVITTNMWVVYVIANGLFYHFVIIPFPKTNKETQ